MEDINVSVIVPVYNVEAYLKQCLKSIDNQTYQNFELILVDDGSTDSCGAICDDYKRNHKNTQVIHQNNQGLSMARNNGVQVSRGEYITFIDSDDYISPDYLSYLVKLVEEENADIAVGRHIIVWDDIDASDSASNSKIRYEVLNNEKALIRMMYEKDFLCTAWAKLYRRELVLKYPYPQGVLYEDLATTYKIVGDLLCRKVVLGTNVIYFWRHRDSSISKQVITKRHIDALAFAEDQISYMEKYYPNAIPAAKYKYVAKIVSYIPCSLGNTYEEKESFELLQTKIKRYSSDVMKDKNARKDIKIRCFATLKGRTCSRFVYGMIEAIKPLRSKYLIRRNGI